jgi:hypothetical protein
LIAIFKNRFPEIVSRFPAAAAGLISRRNDVTVSPLVNLQKSRSLLRAEVITMYFSNKGNYQRRLVS